MSCDNSNNNSGYDKTIFVPSGCLCDEEIEIPCKGPEEKAFYKFSLQRRLRSVDTIVDVKGHSDSDPSIKVQMISCDNKTFMVLISGGTLNTKAAVHFVITTSSEEIRTFTASLPIMPDGTITDKMHCHFVPLPGPQGEKGDAATLKIGKISTGEPGTAVEIENVGTQYDAELNITIPQGEKGEQGSVFLTGDADPVSIDGIVTPAFFVNNRSGDFFYLQKNGTQWEKKGNLIGPQGIQGNAATIAINSVTASEPGSNPSITNVGTDINAKWNIVLPRGQQGTPGKDGKDGKDGLDGTTYLKGKNISFIGDSISTFAGNVVAGNETYYPAFNVLSVDDTWWMQLIKKTGATLLTNDSYSGSCISNRGNGSLQTRFKVIDPKTDICLVLMGANDIVFKVPLGTFSIPSNFSPTNNGFDINTFRGALCNAVVNLQTNYPKTRFVWMLPLKQFDTNKKPLLWSNPQVKAMDLAYQDQSDVAKQYYTYLDQSSWQGKTIAQIRINQNNPPVNVGMITVMTITNPGTENVKVTQSKSFQISAGMFDYDVNLPVAKNEFLAIQSKNQTDQKGAWNLSNTTGTGAFQYFDPETNKWATVQGDLNIGITIKETLTCDTFVEAMKEILTYYGQTFIDMRSLGISSMNVSQYLVDVGLAGYVHPNAAGMNQITNFVYSKMYGSH